MRELIIDNKKIILRAILFLLLCFLAFAIAYIIEVSYIVPFLFLSTVLFLQRSVDNFRKIILPVTLFIVIVIFASKLIVQYALDIPFLSYYIVPVVAVSMLTMLLFDDLWLTVIVTLTSSLCAGKILGDDIDLALIYFIGGIIASLLIHRVRRRSQLLIAGIYTGIIQLFCILIIYPTKSFSLDNVLLFRYSGPVLGSGVASAIIVFGSLSFFEYLFKVTTSVSLLELSDFNHPLLRRMIIEAPGTYQHSLVVGNLAEAAAEAIGVNSLLTRVGAYYHDIGKIEKSEYFSENQTLSPSKHDNLQPSISRLIILNHVKEGVELARKYKLNPIIEEFIAQHHGTSLMYYFYRRAIEDANVSNDIAEEGFRYPGPRPKRKEVAIVLLADSVEAAARSLTEPNPERITEVVHKIINNKFIDGQLDLCELTLNDLTNISATFVRILNAIYHTRVQYPEDKNENTRKESPEKNPYQNHANKKPNNESSQNGKTNQG